MLFNQQKRQTLEYFARRQWTRPAVYAVDLGLYPIRRAYTYLLRLHRLGYIRRGRDIHGKLVYKLGPKGGRWLLRDRESV
jgi:hypothetical protein